MLPTIIIRFTFLIACFYASLLSAAAYVPYQEKAASGGFWAVKGGAGYSIPASFLSQVTLLNSNPSKPNNPIFNGYNNLMQTQQSTLPLFYLGLQKTFVFDAPFFHSLSLGPTFYYQQIQSSGSGALITQPNTTNFDYSLTSQQLSVMLELQWTPFVFWNHFAPYVILGGGMNTNNMAFNVTPSSPGTITPMPNSFSQRQWGFSADVGLGAEILFSKRWGLDLRYLYLKNFNNTLSDLSLDGPVTYNNSSHNFVLSLIYRFGFGDNA